MSGGQFALFLLCVAIATAAQSVTGFALALVLLGLTALLQLAPLAEVANVATVLSLVNAVVWLRGSRKSLDAPALRATTIGSVLGVAIGVALLAWLSAHVVVVLRLLLGLVVIGCAVSVLRRAQPLAQRSPSGSFRGWGVASGVLGGLFSASGPPLVYQFYRQPMPLATVRDTLLAALAASSLMRLLMVVASQQFSRDAVLLSAASTPLAIGLTWWFKKHPPAWPRESVLKLVCALLLFTGAGLVGPALYALLASR